MPKGVYDREDPKVRFWRYVDKRSDEECWIWLGANNAQGYGKISIEGITIGAHRFSLELKLGRKIGPGLVCRHTCDEPACVNPTHLLEGTHAQNVQDCVERGRTPKGVAHYASKLKESQVLEIRANKDNKSKIALATEFGVSDALICSIIHRKRWSHL